ncbi:hypothetical protein ACTWQL_01485 [Pseudalkalibacillus sp. R45]|uniref:hypothetical protein n=1 Tax=Pseudalkalibacillus sp. R45 TaxID=3457433 RepID=UPI003FCCE4CF
MPQYYDNDEYDFESNVSDDRPGCYPKPYCPPPCPPQQPQQVAGAQTQPQQSPLLCVPVGAANNMVAGIQTQQQPGMVAGAQSPYGGAPFYPQYPFYGGFGYGIGWIWAVVVIVVILLIICGCWWWFGGWR